MKTRLLIIVGIISIAILGVSSISYGEFEKIPYSSCDLNLEWEYSGWFGIPDYLSQLQRCVSNIPFTIQNAYAQESKTFEIDGFAIIFDNLHVKEIILDWDSPYLPEGEIILDEAINGTVTIQIPKNMPRTVNLNFGSTLVPINDQRTNIISESESACHYLVSFKFESNDHLKFGSVSVAAGNWEPVIIENKECNYISDKTSSQNGSVFPRHGYQLSHIMSPLKQFKSGIHMNEIQCNEGLQLALKSSHKNTVCIRETSIEKLFVRDYMSDIVSDGLKHSLPVLEN